ncbi:putative coiled-coil domain-containing protein 50-like [Scophthalmus maximus]|uniref:Putative coiled-coil domain-containing protein 50-like n=1 Tax=Scophthalmus maximus TaxID=52904 RepID=A0A2U9C5L7_SCOMX|nr:putative coiled-coil domain-containing protein 50-like [Scophthalmus maximus]
MAELEIDQSNLPRVQEVRQCFAVLEDGVLAHSLQEQEIEQYYTTNVQKNQLVQNDIRVAKRLQDEEDEERSQQSAVVRQASRQLEEQDFEFARVVQEQIQQRAEETRRRELDDEEIAKRLQEEEEKRIRGRSRVQDGDSEGVSLQPDPRQSSLDLGELTQVLQDEELARKLQDEEEMLLRSNSRPPPPPPRSFYPEGDFRVAQVAQDEEIARFMQKQEIKSKRRSRELEGPSSWREHREMIGHHDRRAARDRQVQRERLDSEGLPSPTEDCCPENLPPSPVSTLPPAQHIRNIAEELDPTFQARRQDTERRHQVEQTGPACQSLAGSHAGLNDFLVEPTFIPPTKRQAEKPAGTKPKEKKENCKQQ